MSFTEILIHLAVSFVATAGFCIVFNIPKKQMLFSGLLGVVSWGAYILLRGPVGPVVATFAATCIIVLMSRVFAVIRKCPAILLLVPGIIPLAPGSEMYYTAYYFVRNDTAKAGEHGFLTLKLAFAIVLGIIMVIAVPVHKKRKTSLTTKGDSRK